MLNRRAVITGLLIAAALPPRAGLAEQGKPATIGVLVVEAPGWQQFWQMFRQSMRERHYIEGENVRYELRSAGELRRLPELAADLVQIKVDLIVTWFTPAAQAAKQATRDIPIVMALAGNPVETGLVERLDRPGGNVTGMAGVGAELAGKSVELLREMLPSARRVVALANAPDPFSRPFVEHVRSGAVAAGTRVDAKMVAGGEGVEAAFRDMAGEPPDAIIVQPSLPARLTAELARKHHIPAISIVPGFVQEGGLMCYAASEPDMYRRAVGYVDRILKGAKPADLPVQQPTKFELVINLKTAKALGLSLPPTFIARADEVIE